MREARRLLDAMGWALELPGNNGVIRAQWPTAMTILVIDIGLLRFLLPKP